MDTLHSKDFFGRKQKCRCSSNDIKCKSFIKNASRNPCFVSVKLLRHRNEMPNSEDYEQGFKNVKHT